VVIVAVAGEEEVEALTQAVEGDPSEAADGRFE